MASVVIEASEDKRPERGHRRVREDIPEAPTRLGPDALTYQWGMSGPMAYFSRSGIWRVWAVARGNTENEDSSFSERELIRMAIYLRSPRHLEYFSLLKWTKKENRLEYFRQPKRR